MSFIFIALGMSTLLVFLYKREWLLDKKPFLSLLVLNVVLFILGYVFESASIGDPKLVGFLKMGLLSQLIFLILVTIFRKIYQRNPEDTFWTMDIKLMKDGIFNFIFWVSAIMVPVILIFTKIV